MTGFPCTLANIGPIFNVIWIGKPKINVGIFCHNCGLLAGWSLNINLKLQKPEKAVYENIIDLTWLL